MVVGVTERINNLANQRFAVFALQAGKSIRIHPLEFINQIIKKSTGKFQCVFPAETTIMRKTTHFFRPDAQDMFQAERRQDMTDISRKLSLP